MSRRGKIVIALIVLLIIVGVVLYYVLRGGGKSSGNLADRIFGRGTLPDTSRPTGNQSGGLAGNLPGSDGSNAAQPLSDDEKKKLVQLSKDPVVGAVTELKENKVMYFKLGLGHLFETAFDGTGGENSISNFTIKNIFDARWSHSKSYALITTLDNDATNYIWLRRVGTSTVQTGALDDAIASFDFSPTDDRLASFINVNGNYSVFISNSDGTKARTLFTTPISDFDVYWNTKNSLALKTRTSALAPSLFETLPITGGAPTVVSSDVYGFDILWDQAGTRYLSSSTNARGENLALSLEDNISHTLKNLTFKTLPEKCVFSVKDKAVLYCAIPQSLGYETLPDAWWQGKVEFDDTLWKINIETGESSLLLGGGGFDMIHLFTSPEENYIFFTNKKDSTLWSLKLI